MSSHHFGTTDLPPEQQRALRTAKRLQVISLGYVTSAVIAVALVMGNSQAMRAAWLEDILALLPPLAFLIAARFIRRRPDSDHPYGWHRSIDVAHLAGSLALLVMGVFIVGDSTMALVSVDYPTIGTMHLFGHTLWQGWLMIAVLAYTGIPSMIIGVIKQRLAKTLHDRVLHADGEMDKDDWLTASGAIVGIIGVGLGVWWLDSAIAIAIGLSVVRDGVRNVKAAIESLTDVRARTTELTEPHPVIGRVNRTLGALDWVRDTGCRVRELGHVLHVEAFVAVNGPIDPEVLAEARDRVAALHWALDDIVIIPVVELPEALSTDRAVADRDE